MISCAEFSKFNGSTAEAQFSIFSIVCSASTSVIRSILFTRVKEAGGEINLSSWSKLMIFCLDIDNKNQCSYYFWCLFMRTNHTKWKKKFTVESLFQAYLMLASAVLTLQKKKYQRKANSFSFVLKPAKEVQYQLWDILLAGQELLLAPSFQPESQYHQRLLPLILLLL